MNNIISKIVAMVFPQIDLKILLKRGLQLGKNVYIGTPARIDHEFCWLISIGNNCLIAPNVDILAHDASLDSSLGVNRIGKVTIGSNTYIGVESIILPGVSIGHDVIIGAGSIVTKDIPDNSVAAGNPARVIGSTKEFSIKHRKILETQSTLMKEKALKTQEMKEILQKTMTERSCYIVSRTINITDLRTKTLD